MIDPEILGGLHETLLRDGLIQERLIVYGSPDTVELLLDHSPQSIEELRACMISSGKLLCATTVSVQRIIWVVADHEMLRITQFDQDCPTVEYACYHLDNTRLVWDAGKIYARTHSALSLLVSVFRAQRGVLWN